MSSKTKPVKTPKAPKFNSGLLAAMTGRPNRVLSPREKTIMHALNNWQLYLMLLPAVIYVLVFVYKPMYGIQIAFRNFKFKGGITGSEWVGLENFMRLIKSYWFPITVKNTLTLSFLSILLGFPFPIFFALMVNELKNVRIKNLVQTISYAPHFISTVVICGMLLLFMSPGGGLFDTVLGWFGIDYINSIAINPKAFKWYFVISGIWQGCGWSAIIYFAALAGVDKALLEAAELDGASRIQRIIHINIPTLLPTIIIQLILQCGRVMSVGYEKVLLLQNSLNLSASEVISTYVYKVGLQQYDYSFSTAFDILNAVVNCILLITVNTITKKLTKESLW